MENKMGTQNINFKNTKCKRNMRTFGNNKEAYGIKLRNTWRTKCEHKIHIFQKINRRRNMGTFGDQHRKLTSKKTYDDFIFLKACVEKTWELLGTTEGTCARAYDGVKLRNI
jgi:hypothetical protein